MINRTNKEWLEHICQAYTDHVQNLELIYKEYFPYGNDTTHIRCAIIVKIEEKEIGYIHRTGLSTYSEKNTKKILREELLRDIIVAGIDKNIERLKNTNEHV